MSSLEVPYSHIPQETAVEEGLPEAVGVGRLEHIELKIGAHLIDAFLEEPARFINGYQTLDLGEGSRHRYEDHVLGTVPSGPDHDERLKITADVLRPGKIAQGIHRARKLINPDRQLEATVLIDGLDMVFPAKQLPLFEVE